jgi:hypothetical protein
MDFENTVRAILEKHDEFSRIESDRLREVIDILKVENARLRGALIFRGYDPDSELKYHEQEAREALKGGE